MQYVLSAHELTDLAREVAARAGVWGQANPHAKSIHPDLAKQVLTERGIKYTATSRDW